MVVRVMVVRVMVVRVMVVMVVRVVCRRAPPGVPVLVPDLLLHLCICQCLQQGAPLVGVTRVPDGNRSEEHTSELQSR